MNVVRTSQAVPYNITPRDDIITFFNNFSDYMEEEEMWTRSSRSSLGRREARVGDERDLILEV